MKIIVVGAGILGASLAYYLSKHGASVTVLDPTPPGGLATRQSFGWVNANYPEDRDYFDLRVRGMAAYAGLIQELDLTDCTRWHGSLVWEDSAADLRAQVATLDTYGYPARLVDADEIRRLEPKLSRVPDLAVHTAHEGGIAADLLAARLLKASGARVLSGVKALSLSASGLETSGGLMTADHVVLALGAKTEDWLASQGVPMPMDNKAGLTLHTNAQPALFRHILMTSDVHMNQLPDGSMIVGEIFSGASQFDDPLTFADAMLDRVMGYLPQGMERAKAEIIHSATRPVPKDGLPIIGKLPGHEGVSLVAMHSGITLAPIVGKIMADYITGGRQDPALAAFRPDRFKP